MSRGPRDVLLDESDAAFMVGGVSINVAAADVRRMPCVVRAQGCRISADRREVTVFVCAEKARDVLTAIRGNGAVAVVFSQPSTHQTIQLKGVDATVVSLEEGDEAHITAYCNAFAQELRGIGYTPAFAQTLVSDMGAELLGVRFTPSDAFQQTPGPAAGRRLRN